MWFRGQRSHGQGVAPAMPNNDRSCPPESMNWSQVAGLMITIWPTVLAVTRPVLGSVTSGNEFKTMEGRPELRTYVHQIGVFRLVK